MNTLPQAHSATHPGLRGHSIGSDYPWTVRGIGNGAEVEYQPWNCQTGHTGPVRPTATGAYLWLEARRVAVDTLSQCRAEWHALAKVTP